MKKNRDYIMFLEDIIDSVKMIEKYTKGYSQKSFSSAEGEGKGSAFFIELPVE